MDRRTIWAILLMMVIAITPAIFIKRPPKPAAHPPAGSSAAKPAPKPAPPPAAAPLPARADTAPASRADSGAAAPSSADTVRISSPLYTYGISSSGGRLVEAQLERYRSNAPADNHALAQILPPDSKLLGLTLVLGTDTIPTTDWQFSITPDSLAITGAPAALHLTAAKGAVALDLTYTFRPDDYQIAVSGRVTGVGPNGGQLLVGMGPTLANTEADSEENHRALALVTKQNDADRTDFSSLKPGEPRTVSGPLEWAAIKSKYFVTAIFAFDSSGGDISGAIAQALPPTGKRTTSADVRLTLPLRPSGEFGYSVYAGPMEYDRLGRVGHDFDDVNPYGWPGVRTLIRPVAGAVRSLLVWMHDHLSLPYGLVLVFFGVLVRLLLWPLNQKAMRANLQLQAVQPLMKEMQDKYKSDPQRLQQEMFKLYKEHGVNPLGGCWPMLIPMPVLFALFFVFQNTIELRGASFLWLPDLSRPDPYYIIPLVMGLSMFGLSKVGQMGMEPNPQMKMMLYVMPAMMTFLFLKFASGLNLYYAVSNIASIPQQWMLARERVKRLARQIVEVKTKEPSPGSGKKRKA
jgi:YidC/Oxa1 family membrane protein insertase